MYWDQDHMEKDKRGGLDYYFPRGWYLNITLIIQKLKEN